MSPRLSLFAALISISAAAQNAEFDKANRSLQEQSFSRACDAFTALVKSGSAGSLAREAEAKRLISCTNVGRESWSDLQKFAGEGEKDFARAYASAILAERGYINFDAALPLLKQAAGGEGRQAAEAKSLLVRGALNDQGRNSYNRARCESMADVVTAYASNANDVGHAQYQRAMCRFQDPASYAAAEKDLKNLGDGKTEWADDALYLLGQRREGQGKYVEALEFLDRLNGFSSVTSNQRENGLRLAAQIRAPTLGVGVSYFELSGQLPKVNLSWRNQTSVQFTLKKCDPLAAAEPQRAANELFERGTVVSTWSIPVEVAVKHAIGSKTFDLEVKGPGIYALEARSGDQRSVTMALVTQTATVAKSDGHQTVIWVSDVETGAAQPDAEVSLFHYKPNGGWQKQTGKTDATGLARFEIGKENAQSTGVVWTRVGTSYSFATTGNWYNYSRSREELAYVMTDRPLYKPKENVGIKVFLRSRQNGPTEPIANRAFTLTISDPTGKTVSTAQLTTNAFGTASYSLALDVKATLGQWNMTVQSPSSSQYYQQTSSYFRVEEYKPPEASVSVAAEGNPKPGETVKFKVKATYLSGGPVPNATGRALITVQPWAHTWAPWPQGGDDTDESAGGYGDYEEEYRPSKRGYQRYWGGNLASHTVPFKTGADGTAIVEVPKTELNGQTSVSYEAQVLVTDASRREISGRGSVHVSSAPFFVDIRSSHYIYKPGEKVTIQLRAEDNNSRPAEPSVRVQLVRIGTDGQQSRIAETMTLLKGGVGVVQLDGDAIGQVQVQVFSANSDESLVLAQTDLWLTSESKPLVPPGAGFQLYVDKAPLKVGEGLRALLVTPQAGGHSLISIENEELQFIRGLEMKGRARFIEIPLTGTMAPNAWLSIHRFENGQHLRQVRPIKVQGSEVELQVKVALGAPAVEPGAKVAASITATGTDASLETALTVVDEALFAIAPERTDFLNFFARHQRQLGVRTATTCDQANFRPRENKQVKAPTKQSPADEGRDTLDEKDRREDNKKAMGAVAMGDAPAPTAPAAESESAAPKSAAKPSVRRAKEESADADDVGQNAFLSPGAPIKIRTNFSSTAGWYPSVQGKAGKPMSQQLTLPDSLTSWKAVATVVSDGPWLGRGDSSIRTAKPLMVRLQAPRFFIENDEVVLSAVIESHLSKTANLEVSITAPGLKALTPTSKSIKVDANQVTRFDARFKVVELGERTLTATVRGGGTGDAMEWKLPAFVHGSAQRQFFAGQLGDRFSFDFEMPEKRKASLTRFELTLSPSLLSVMLDGLPYLAQYPYGCVEQTLSRFVPATIARRTVTELKLPTNRLPPDLDNMVAQGLDRLMMFQHSDGGWGWWQNDNTSNWMTAYVVYALSLAKEAGVNVDANSIERGRTWLTSHLGGAKDSDETYAFMVYALTATGKAPADALNTIFQRRTRYSPRARALVALSLLNAKSPNARIAVENLDDIVKAAQARPDAAVGDANDIWSTSAAIEATSLTLMAMVRYDLKSPLIRPLTDFLVLRRNGGKFRTTRDTAFALYALSELAKREGANAQAGTFVVLVNGKEIKRVPFSKGGLDLSPIVLGDGAFVAGKNHIEVKRDGAGTGYYAGTIDVFNQNAFIKGVGGDVKVKRTYTLLGKPSTTPGSAETEYGMPVESGTRVRVDVDITANKAVEFVMLEDLKPAGFEAVILQSGPAVCNYACSHAELRTDRVAMFLQAIPVGTTRLSYELRAETPGKFSALPARFEAMYAPEIQATADEMRFEVRDEPAGTAAH